MDKIALSAESRPADAKANHLRKEGRIPCVIYGNVENTLVTCGANELTKVYQKAGESTVVEIALGSKKVPVLFHAIDHDPLKDTITHVDFYAVDMNKEVEADVEITFSGESPAVKELSAVLIHTLDTVTVRALPANLPHDLPVDISTLVELDSSLTVADIPVPQGVVILTDPEEVIIIAQAPREEEPEEVAPVVAEGAEGAVAAEGAEGEKKEGEGEDDGKKDE